MSCSNGEVVIGLSAGQSNGIAAHGGLSPEIIPPGSRRGGFCRSHQGE